MTHTTCPLCDAPQPPISGVHARTCEGCGAHLMARVQTVDGATTLIVVARPADSQADAPATSPAERVYVAWDHGGCGWPGHGCALRDAVDFVATPLEPSLIDAMRRMAAREHGGER